MIKRDLQDRAHKRDGDCHDCLDTPCQFSQFFSAMQITRNGSIIIVLLGYRSSGAKSLPEKSPR
jgi:hypothetical protein